MYGWAAMSRDDLGRPVVDTDGEHIPVEELERAAQRAFLRRGGRGSVGVMHTEFARADLVESFVLSAEKRAAFELGAGPEGWMVGLESRDPEVIKLVRSGTLLELSIRGKARINRTPRGVLKSRAKAGGEPSASDEVGVMEDLELADVELLSIVDRGASANDRVKSRIVLVKRRTPTAQRYRPMTVAKARSAQAIVAELLEQGVLAEMAPEDKDTLLSAVSSGAAPAPMGEEVTSSDAPAPKSDGEPMPPKSEGMTDEEQKMADEMAKRDTETKALHKRLADLEKRNRDLEKKAEARELESVVKAEMAYVPGMEVSDVVKVLQEGRENLSKDAYAKLEASLKATSEAMRKGELLKTYSHQRPVSSGSGTPYEQLRDVAKALKDENPKLSMADALKEAGRQRPDLLAEYRNSVPRSGPQA